MNNLIRNKKYFSLFLANIIIHILEEHPEKMVIQWMEISEKNGGLGISSSNLGRYNSCSAMISVFCFFVIFPNNHKPEYTSSILKYSCYIEGFLLILVCFFKFLNEDWRYNLYFIWNFLHSTCTNIIYAALFIVNSQVIEPKTLGSFYSHIKFMGGFASMILYGILGYFLEIVLKNTIILSIFGKSSTLLFFGPFGILFFSFWSLISSSMDSQVKKEKKRKEREKNESKKIIN